LADKAVTDLVVNYDVEKNAVDLSDQPWVRQRSPVLDQPRVNGKVYVDSRNTWYYLVIQLQKDIFSKLNLSVPSHLLQI